MADNKDQAAIERINLIYRQLRAGEKVNLSDVASVAVALERVVKERDSLWQGGVRAVKRALKAMIWWRSKYRTLHSEATDTVLVLNRNFVKMKRRAGAAEEALRDLHAAQNDPPLTRDSQAWTMAMQKADDVLGLSRT